VQLEEAREGILMIERAAVAQQQLIDDLLDVSRMASGKFRLTLRDTDLAKAIEEAVESVRQAAATRKVNLKTDLSADVGVVRADPDRLQQVVWNLLTNAVKFTPSGGTVSVTLAPYMDGIEIVVQDTGIGIRPEFLPQVFDRFRQADSSTSRQHGGLGLGLAIAKQLVELHGGTVSAFSEGEGRGARFTVRLPHLEQSSGPVSVGQDEDPVAAEGALSGVDVLLVEDDAGTRQATAILLRQHGAQVREVDSAAAARDTLKIRDADLLVSDVGLAGEDGYMLIQELRRVEQAGSKAPLTAVAVTAFAGAEDRKKALTAGFDEHISKPLNPHRFIATLARLLRKR
jgi:CheY-like chemotaxis protein/two-component sensor histidine kinase